MSAIDLLGRRLRNQKLTRPEARTPADVVEWLGAVQAQDFPSAKWGVGLRAKGMTDADVEQAFNVGAILRTHVLRPTWHFVTPADIRWILALTAPRVHAANGSSYRQHGLDHALFARSQDMFARALEGGKHLTRAELGSILTRGGIPADGQRLAYLVMRAELDAVICSGARRGTQFTYALLDERVPPATALDRDTALAKLTRRYFASHGPATLRDYAWWSGLTVREAKAGIDMVRPAMATAAIDGRAYWFVAATSRVPRTSAAAYLLPNYDEYLIAYKDREAVVGSGPTGDGVVRGADSFAHHLVVDGRLAGSWKRTRRKDSLLVDVAPYRRLSRAETHAVAEAAERHGRFIDMPVIMSTSRP